MLNVGCGINCGNLLPQRTGGIHREKVGSDHPIIRPILQILVRTITHQQYHLFIPINGPQSVLLHPAFFIFCASRPFTFFFQFIFSKIAGVGKFVSPLCKL